MFRSTLKALLYCVTCPFRNKPILLALVVMVLCIRTLGISPIVAGIVVAAPGFTDFPGVEAFDWANKFTYWQAAWELQVVASPDTVDTRRIILDYKNPVRNFIANVIFTNDPSKVAKYLSNSTIPVVIVEFQKISKSELTYSLGYFASDFTWPTSKMFLENETVFAPRIPSFYNQILLPLQMQIDEAYITQYWPNSKAVGKEWRLSNMPYPSYKAARLPTLLTNFFGYLPPHSVKLRSLFVNLVYYLMPFLLLFSECVVSDRTTGMKDLLNVNGAPRWMLNTSWLFFFGLGAFLEAAVLTIVIKAPRPSCLWCMSGFFLFVVLLVYSCYILCVINFILSVVRDPKLALPTWVFFIYLTNSLCSYIMTAARGVPVLLIVAMFPSGSLLQILMAYQEYENANVIMNFSNSFWTPVYTLPAGVLVIMMIVGIVICSLLAWYIDAVMPGPYGIRRPWHLGLAKVQPTDSEEPLHHSSAAILQTINTDVPVGLKATRISKKFGKFHAVNNLSIKFVQNQITVLLGHNGAGKTTLFSMLSGMTSPTSGNVSTDQLGDIFERQNLDKFREHLGYCPQQNVLYDRLTVHQHLMLFGLLKNLSLEESREQSHFWAETLGLDPHLGSLVKILSGGMKRRLCLAMAVIGHPAYLLLDEPTSGVDVASQRQIWHFLQATKKNCTIIITTHSMEEAEVLGDWVAIMSHGQLKCYGSVKFLKNMHGSGYRLDCVVDERRRSDLFKTVRKYAPSAQIVNQSDHHVVFELQVSTLENLYNLLHDLDANNVEVSLTYNTLGDVFVKLESEGQQPPAEETVTKEVEGQRHRVLQQIYSLFVIRARWALSNWTTLGFLLFLYPIAEFLVLVFTVLVVYEPNRYEKANFPSLKLTFDVYRGTTALMPPLIQSKDTFMYDYIKSAMSSNGIAVVIYDGDDLQFTLKDMMKKDTFFYRSKMLFAFNISGVLTAYYSVTALHSSPIAYAAVINALLNGDATITTHYVPYAGHSAQHCHQFVDLAVLTMSLLLAFCIIRLSDPFILYTHEDRISGFKHIQKMTKVSSFTYWFTSFIFDFALYWVASFLVLILIVAGDQSFLLSFSDYTYVFSLALMMNGMSALPFVYASSFFFKLSWNQLTFELLNLFVLVFSYLWHIFTIVSGSPTANFQILYLIPIVVFFEATYKIISWTSNISRCQNCVADVGKQACEMLRGNSLLGSLQREMVWFAIDALLYFVITLCLEEGWPGFVLNEFRKWSYGRVEYSGNIDPDVAAEKQRVALLPQDQAGMVCDGLGKTFSNKITVVYDVSFAVDQGECFGLLGANGAGKSTTFGMLAGTVHPTKGQAVAVGHELTACKKSQYLRNIGYCPQADCYNQQLSGRSLISHFARLRGIPESRVTAITDKWLALLDMTGIADKPSKYYSGGNKRKVSVALALVGTPKVVLLDEPTTGVDVVTRRRIWDIVKLTMEVTKQTVLLSSHSMTECEFLCNRLAIIVGGTLRCIGPISSLKQKFGRKCLLRVTMTQESSEEDQLELENKIEAALYPHFKLQEKEEHYLGYLVNLDTIKLHDIFATMLKIKKANPVVEDFNVGDASLEHIFQSFINTT